MVQSELSEAAGFDTSGVRRRTPITRSVYGDIVQFLDFLLVILVAIGVAAGYNAVVLGAEFDAQSYIAAGIVGATALTTILRRDGLYEFDRLLSPVKATKALVSRWSVVILGLIAFAFALKVSDNFSRFWLFGWFFVSAATLAATRLAAAGFLQRAAREGGAFARRVAVIGSNDIAAKFTELAQSTDRAVSVVGVWNPDFASVADARGFDLTGELGALARAARNGEIDDIVIAETSASTAEMDALVRRLSILPVSIAVCPNLHWLNHTGGEIVKIGAAPLLNLYRRPLEGWGSLLKTLEDKLLGGVLMLAASPLLLAIAVAIKLQGKGPILFSQQRHGFNHEVFRIYKFRTMTVAEDGDEVKQAAVDDPRITPLGKVLRRYSLDELPQLLNVLKGEMSLVGPRPHALAHNHAYARTIENYSGRHKMKPGITGWAQVNGLRGETSENEMMEARVRYDLDYIDNWSLLFDLKILALTVIAVLFPKNAH